MPNYYAASTNSDLHVLTPAERADFRDQAAELEDWRTVDEIDAFNADHD